ncbi:GNAT family N-acetyltransferase [Luteolibacter yonseiensis]|uniref:GNAT family N-acetyltransferase n=1 Tax=Luteolibacter yonseiensis TaxID=1144680 RepID=A0A934VCR5_9BACT|nr:GNAT family N-acetyltransferase [Luteolibacter yonseiensis]MBK1816759.1 GNAT family N-acetyltransferase [Luteolibacter yonseiensis]
MIVRPATASDAGPIARVQVISWQEAYRGILPLEYLAGLSVYERQEIWAKSILQEMPKLLVAEIDGQVVGFLAMGPCRDDRAASSQHEIWAFYVEPARWSQGVGYRLWLASRDILVECGAGRISLWVIAGNERAIRFYRSAGFVPEAGSKKPFELGGVTLEEERYVWELA